MKGIPDEFKNITATININALKHNLEYIRKKSNAEVMPVLKANAYGHGIVEIAKICRKLDVKYIGVATLGEAIKLRRNGDKGRILGWLYDVNSDQVKKAVAKNIDIAIFDDTHIPIISTALPKNATANIHLFVDTGIDRNGIPYENALTAAKQITSNSKFKLVGVMSHLCCANNNKSTIMQLKLFKKLKDDLHSMSIIPELFHISATNGILKYSDKVSYDVSDKVSYEVSDKVSNKVSDKVSDGNSNNIYKNNMVRCGAGLYGLNSVSDKNLIPVLSLSSIIIQLKYIPKGAGIGYNRKYITKRKEYVAIIPIGYADLLPLTFDKTIHVMVNETKRCVLGLESMDQIVIRANIRDKIGDIVKLFGNEKHGFINIKHYAKQSNTTPLNIISHMGERVKFVYS
jgi:alanine racemase